MCLGSTLVAQLRMAILMHAKHQALHEAFTGRYHPDVVAKWEKMVVDWENDSNKENPYKEHVMGKQVVTLH